MVIDTAARTHGRAQAFHQPVARPEPLTKGDVPGDRNGLVVSEWQLEGQDGLAQIRKHTWVETRHPDEFYVRGVTISTDTVAISRMALSPHRQVGPPTYLEAGHASTCVLLSGTVTLAADSGRERLNRGHVYPAHCAARDSLDVIAPAELVIVTPRLVLPNRQSAPADRSSTGNWRMLEPSFSLFESLCDWMCAASADAATDSIEAAAATLLTLLDHPVHDVDSDRHGLRGSAPTVVYDEAIRIVDAEFRDPGLNAPSLARRLRISLRTLHRAFESHSMSVSQEIRRRRIEYAEELLRSARHARTPVSEIARICGAPSIAYLRIGIKEKHDVSPSRLREMWSVGALST
ncbi:helix-turn-helix transcriptional regulator [Prescottella agglutinans]|uniref:helix-turn-helix transcriptional regulator n=1 Tax=Prescottella agglutinans TaxID=1644129 RepID=UPI003D9592F9